jgi:hypothetical protein
MVSIQHGELAAFFGPNPSPTPGPLAAPWISPTADRILRTTATPVIIDSGLESLPGKAEWNKNTAAFSAVSLPDPKTGERYFCLDPGAGVRYDFALNRAQAPETPISEAGRFWATPAPDLPARGQFAAYLGWAYAIDTSTGTHYFLCATSWTVANTPNSLFWTPVGQIFGILGPPFLKEYRPTSGVIQPQGLWATGELIWFTNSDGTLWQVELNDILTGKSGSLKSIPSVGVVQAVISDGTANPTFYVLSAVPEASGHALVEFVAGEPTGAVTIQSGCNLGGIKTTPDGAVWKVIPDLNPGPATSQVALLVPPYPANGQLPAWIDPFGNADPLLFPTGLQSTIMDAVPLSATNILLRTTANYGADQSFDWPNKSTWQLTRVGIGVLDQAAQPFPLYSGDSETAYQWISGQLITDNSGTPPASSNDIRAHYPQLSSSQASAYYSALMEMQVANGFSDQQAWTAVQNELKTEMYDLVSTLSFWEMLINFVNLQNAVQSLALNYVSNAVSIPTTATLINTSSGALNALVIAGGVTGTVLSGVASVLGAVSPLAAAIVGGLSSGASLTSVLCSAFGSQNTPYAINVSDPMYLISAKLADVENILGHLFTNILTVIGQACAACSQDLGRNMTVAGLFRNGAWSVDPPAMENSKDPADIPQSFSAYYAACVVSFLKAFVPLVAAENLGNGAPGENWPTYSGAPVYVGPTYSFQDSENNAHVAALLQYAAPSNQQVPLGQDLDTVLFTTCNCAYADVFLNWGIPSKPQWIS